MVRRTRPYLRRRRGPLIALVAVLATVAVVTWTTVLIRSTGPARSRACPAPTAAGAPAGRLLAYGSLDAVPPLPPGQVKIRVLNAGGQRGQANLVAAQLADLGFAEGAEPINDPLFPDGKMQCYAQLRFGPNGAADAGTVALVLPCAELVRDGRPDAGVDVAVGTAFGDLNPPKAVKDALAQLSGVRPGSTDAGAADSGAAAGPPPTVDPAVLAQARTC